jgi:NDP-sugar pyrophosphorylase family protein
MVLAAGLGTRLRPLSYEMPKPVVPVLGRPLCTYNLEFLMKAGVKAFVMNVSRQPKLIRQKVEGWAGRKARVDFTVEPEILGTGGGIWNARAYLSDGTFVTANSDTVVRFPFGAALAFHRKKGALATLVLFPDPEKKYTPVWTDAEGRITGFGREAGTGTRSGFYTGFQLLEPALLARIPAGRASCIIRETHAPLVREGAPVYGFFSSGDFLDFGSPADYLSGTMALLSEKPDARRVRPSAPDPGAAILPPSHIGRNARISPGARIGPEAVVEDGASVGEGASVVRAILWPGASLPAGRELSNAILTPRRLVPVPPVI